MKQRKFLRGHPSFGDRRAAPSQGLHPFTKTELRNVRQRLNSLGTGSYGNAVTHAYGGYAK